MAHAQDGPGSFGNVPVESAVFVELAGEIYDAAAQDLSVLRRRRRGNYVVAIHQAAEDSFIFPAINARIGIEDGFGERVLRSRNGRATMNDRGGRETRAVELDAEDSCRDRRR